jgi:hypothetical protein
MHSNSYTTTDITTITARHCCVLQVFGVVMPLVKAKQDVQYEQVTDAMKAFRAYDALRTARTDARQVGIRAKKAGEKKEADKDKAAKGGGKDDEVQ